MAEQEKPQGPKRRSSHKAAKRMAAGAVVTNGEAPAQRPARPHVKGGSASDRAGATKPAPSPTSNVETKARGWMAEFSRYLKSVKTEFHRVTWPSKQELKTATMVVVATLFVLTLYLFLVNVLFTGVFSRLGG